MMSQLKTYQVCEIARGTYVINEAGMAAMYLAVGEERALLIDTGVGMTDLKAVIASLTDLPYDVVLTHGHMDHIGGAAQFEEVYIHPADASALQPVNYEDVAKYVDTMCAMGCNDVYHCSSKDIKRLSSMPLIKELRNGMIFDLGGRRLKVLETPGHTDGSCSLIDDRERILFSGDACNVNLLCLWGTVGQMQEGLMRIKAHEKEFDRNFNGHVGYAGMPLIVSMPQSVLDDALYICQTILDGSAEVSVMEVMPGRIANVVSYGNVRICFNAV